MMGRNLLGRAAALSLLAAGLCLVGVQPASALLIDDFNSVTGISGDLITNPGGSFLNLDYLTGIAAGDALGNSGNVIGGERGLSFNVTGNTEPSTASFGISNSGRLNLATGPGVSGSAFVMWDAGGSGLGANLLADGSTRFGISLISVDLDLILTMTVVDSNSNVAIYQQSNLSPGAIYFAFTGFTNYGGTDFTDVESIRLTLSGPPGQDALDARIDWVETSVPEPATMTLLGLGAVVLGIRRRMRRH